MAVTQEFIEQVSEALMAIGDALENAPGYPRGASVITKEEEMTDTLSLPGVMYDEDPITHEDAQALAYVQIPWSVMSSVLASMKTATREAEQSIQDVGQVIDNAQQATAAANTAAENADSSREQIESDEQARQSNEQTRQSNESTRQSNEQARQSNEQTRQSNEETRETTASSDHTRAEEDHTTAAGDHTTADQDHTRAEEDHEASEAATGGAENVNAVLNGMTVTVTNRQGESSSVMIGFQIYRTYATVSLMNADAANVPEGKFVLIATTDKTSVDNAKLYCKNSQDSFSFLADLDQASSSAWADWLNNKKPLIEQATTDANNAAALANEKAGLAESIYNTVRTWYYGSANNGFKATVESWIANTQTAWDNWFSDSLATGVRKLWNDFWANINSKWTNFFGEEDGTPTKGVQKTWTDWFTGRATDWNDYKDAKDADWTNYKSGKDTDWNNYKDGKDTDWNSYKGGKDTDWGTYKGGKDTIWDNWFGTDDTSGVQKQWKDTKADAIAATTNANEKAGLANEKALYADNMASHPPYIADGSQSKPGDIGYVHHWDYANQTYVKGLRLSLDWSTMDANEKAAIEQDILNAIGFDETPTENSEHAVTSRGLYAALLLKQDNLDFADDEDAEAIWKDYVFTTTD